ncbi:ExeA family protein [uncultured Shewanella sp.]|uniref:ExeA family protein n=1 Tax=Shewanella atlantica TaxID=271099 RepID=UPI0026374CBA|nr:AAA family ATPase [uncultured Shewanella sp.]
MFQAFYRLNDNPFSNQVSSDNLYLSEHHREALTCLNYGLNETGGFLLLTGVEGSGKTSVINAFLKQVSASHDTALITNPSLTEHELLAKVCDKFDISYQGNPSLKCFIDLLSQFLLNNELRGRRTLLIIDEAQYLSAAVLEQLRLLTNLETDTKKLLQLVLVGRPELGRMLNQEELRQVGQRITMRYHIASLSLSDTFAYIEHHLRLAGHPDPLFTRAAIKAVHRYSGGLPSLINRICEQALIIGHAQSRDIIDSGTISTAVSQTPEIKLKPRNDYALFTMLGATAVMTIMVLLTLTVALSDRPQNTHIKQSDKALIPELAVVAPPKAAKQSSAASETMPSQRLQAETGSPISKQVTKPEARLNTVMLNNDVSYQLTSQAQPEVAESEASQSSNPRPTEVEISLSTATGHNEDKAATSDTVHNQSWYVLQLYAGRTRPDDLYRLGCENINLLIRHHNDIYYLTSQHLTLTQAKQARRVMTDRCKIDAWIKPLPKGWQPLIATQG